MSSTQPPVQISHFSLPSGSRRRAVAIAAVLMILSSRRGLLAPGSTMHDRLLGGHPTALKVAKYTQNGLFYFLFGAHSIEMVLFAFMLRKHGLDPSSAAWWKWMALCFVGGKFCFDEFGEVIRGEQGKVR